jgi:putative transcriptional regulator
MQPKVLARLIVMLVAMVVPATMLYAALPGPAESPGRTFLTGQLLIASTSMGDPRFDHSVILMVRHNTEGALGIVINRPLGQRSLAAILRAVGGGDSAATSEVPVYLGGPVEIEHGFVVHSAEYHRDDTLDIDGHVAMTASVDILRDIANQKGPQKSLIAFGYAGWGPGQLEGEIAREGWFTAPEDLGLVFDDDRDQVWEHAMKRRTQDL